MESFRDRSGPVPPSHALSTSPISPHVQDDAPIRETGTREAFCEASVAAVKMARLDSDVRELAHRLSAQSPTRQVTVAACSPYAQPSRTDRPPTLRRRTECSRSPCACTTWTSSRARSTCATSWCSPGRSLCPQSSARTTRRASASSTSGGAAAGSGTGASRTRTSCGSSSRAGSGTRSCKVGVSHTERNRHKLRCCI